MASDSSFETLLPLLLLCCMLPLIMRQPGSQQPSISTEMDIWFTAYALQEAYDVTAKTIDKIREKAMAVPPKKSRNPFSRKKPETRYNVEKVDPPRIYRVNDAEDGPLFFEFSEAEGGGTQVKATFTAKTKSIVQTLKSEMPARQFNIAELLQKFCHSCGKQRQPDWQVCPYCGAKYG